MTKSKKKKSVKNAKDVENDLEKKDVNSDTKQDEETKKTVAEVFTEALGSLDEEIELELPRLTPLEMARLELHETRMQLQTAIIEKFKHRNELLSIEYQRNKSLIQEKMRQAGNSRTEAQNDYTAQRDEAEKRLSISFHNCTISDDGLIRRLEEDTEG